jgi:putative NIF3 family GTP cyclohydrolase 1 type 2
LGQFKPEPGSRPYIGSEGSLEKTKEIRLEMALPTNLIPKATTAIRENHPYEEPAFHFAKIERPGPGLGLLAEWPKPQDPVATTASKLGLKALAFAGPKPGPIQKVALLPGAGGDFILMAQKAGAKALITGEMSYHQALLAEEAGLLVIAAGHFETEKPGLDLLGQELEILTRRSGATIDYIYLHDQSPWQTRVF